MRRSLCLGFIASLAMSAGAFAQFWSFTETGPFTIPSADQGILLLEILLDDPMTPGKSVPFIESMELELTGLSHTFPDDLDIYLIDPNGVNIEIMADQGGMTDVVNATLIFNDSAGSTIPDAGPIASNATSTFKPSGLGTNDSGFGTFVGDSAGTNHWHLLIIDDTGGDGGSLQSFTVRVPEPATMGLLAVGGLAMMWRRSRK